MGKDYFMVKQFLLNPDGTVPLNANLELLQAEGIPLVMPTEIPKQYGMIAIEKEPQQDDNGIWHQVWGLEPLPDTIAIQPADLLSTLTEDQKNALLLLLQEKTFTGCN